MILLTEIQNNKIYSDNIVKNETKILNEAIQISHKLVDLYDKSLFDDIKIVHIINTDKNENDIYLRIFQKFNLDYSFYFEKNIDYAKPLALKFLTPESLNKLNPDTKSRMNRLIQRISIVNSTEELNPNDSYLIYLPLSSNLESKLSHIDKLCLINDKEKENVWNIGTTKKIQYSKYVQVKNLMYTNIDRKKGEEWEEYNYKHHPFLQHFGEEFYQRLNSITYGSKKTNKAYFYGKDYFIAKKSIDYFMSTEEYDKYNLIDGLRPINKNSDKFMFASIDCLESKMLNELSKSLWPLETTRKKIALQGLKIDLDFYFSNFEHVPIPDSKLIQSVISSLFVALLIDKHKLRGDVRILFNTLKINGFNKFLNDLVFISQLDTIVNKINEVDVEDLLNAPEFWIKFQEEVDSFNTKTVPKIKYDVDIKLDIWNFNEKGGMWTIVKNGEVIHTHKTNALTYLALILKYHELNEWSSINGYKLQRAILKFENKNYKVKLSNSKASGAWRVQKNYLLNKLGNQEIKEFIDSYIEDKGDNILVNNKEKFQFKISTSVKIAKDFFADLSSDQESYK